MPKLHDLGELADQKSCWLVFSDACGLGAQMVERLEQKGQDVITVMAGEQFRRVNDECLYHQSPTT